MANEGLNTQVSPTNVSDVIEWEEPAFYGREEGTIIDTPGGTDMPVGQLLKASGSDYIPALEGDDADVIAILLRRVSGLAATGTAQAPILARGPAIVNPTELYPSAINPWALYDQKIKPNLQPPDYATVDD